MPGAGAGRVGIQRQPHPFESTRFLNWQRINLHFQPIDALQQLELHIALDIGRGITSFLPMLKHHKNSLCPRIENIVPVFHHATSVRAKSSPKHLFGRHKKRKG